MPNVLCITVRFLDPMPGFHGRADGGEPEWPPSPLRLFQALVDAAASRWRALAFNDYAKPFLTWMEKPAPPTIIAPTYHVGVPVRIAVPNNDLDVWAGPLSRGLAPKKQPNELKAMKTVRSTHLTGDAVHYLYPVADADPEFAKHKETLVTAARSITHLGWGVDMVAGNAAEMNEEEAASLVGKRWRPTPDGSGTQLRVPRQGTLQALMTKHEAFLNRLSNEGFRPVPPLTAFDVVGYRRDTDPPPRSWVAFRIASIDPDDPGPAFDTPRRCREVAAWARHATGTVCNDWPFGPTAGFVHGHGPNNAPLNGDGADERFMYLPLPSIERRGPRGEHVGAIRRVLIAAPPEFQDRIDWIRRRLPGQELIAEGGNVQGLLSDLPTSDWVLRQYVGESRVWSTVTPLILPGHDEADARIVARRVQSATDAVARRRVRERAEERTRNLLSRAFLQSGLPPELVARARFEWRPVGFRPGVEMANRFAPLFPRRPPSYHVRVTWPVSVAGPLAIGAGRYRGFGIMAAEAG